MAVGVYQMARAQEAARKHAYRELISAEINSRAFAANRLASAVAGRPAFSDEDLAALRRATGAAVVDAAQYFEGMVVLSDTSDVLVAWPEGLVADGEAPALTSILDGASGTSFLWSDATEDRLGRLWVVVPIRREEGSRLLAARMRTDFIDGVIAEIARAPEAPIAFVFDEAGRVLFGEEAAMRLAGAEIILEPASAEDGEDEVAVTAADDSITYSGYYQSIDSLIGLDWSVGVVENAEWAIGATWDALRPSMTAWLVALMAALIAALAVAGWVTKPLKLLERRARAVAAGAHIEPEDVDRHDEIGRLLEAFNSVTRRLNRLSDLAELLARASDRELVLDGVTSSIAHMLRATDVDVLLLADDGAGLELVSAEGELSGGVGASVALVDVPWIAASIESGEPVECADTGDPLLALHTSIPDPKALAVPLRAGSDMVGVVALVRDASREFAASEVEMVRSFAAQASVALQNARLFEEERRSRREAEALREVAEHVTFPHDLEQALDGILVLESRLLGMGATMVIVADRASHGLHEGLQPAMEQAWLRGWFDAFGVSGVVSGTPVVITAASGPRALVECVRSIGALSALVTPLMRDDAVVGLLVVSSPHAEPALGARQLEIAETVGKQVSLAMQNAYLFEQARRRADNLETIFRISQAVGSSLQSRVVLNRVMDVVQKILAADAVMLMTYDAGRKLMTIPMARGILHRDMLDMVFRPGEDVPGRVFESREVERFETLSGGETPLIEAAYRQDMRSLLAVPLMARGRSIGVLAVFSRLEGAFSIAEMELLSTFASQAALAIDTADLFSREHRVAQVLQESILPARLPRLPGIEASSVYLPAGSEAEIGGDYYDLFEAPDGRIVLAIGDVCGKGVIAATKTSMIKYAIRGMVAADLGPARVLDELNGMIVAAGDPASIVTLWIGYVDVATGLLTYANGGHPPILILQPGRNRVERLGTTGALLGAVTDPPYEERTIRAEPGSTVLMYTDGVTEARSGRAFFGEGRVRRALRQGGSAAAVTQRLLSLVQRFSGGALRDDAAILAVTIGKPIPVTDVSTVTTSGYDSRSVSSDDRQEHNT
jgi:serine phosphatase RsbU (regulator of sigma subunit)/HAMP domain-containing protein